MMLSSAPGQDTHADRLHSILYEIAKQYARPTVLELGTARGKSAAMFLRACEEQDGRLVSVDIRDCSRSADSPRFHFVQSDSTNAAYVVGRCPFLKDGIDVIYIDSLHTREHVEHEVGAWWPFLKEGSTLLLDDVDPHIYRPGQRKDNAWQEMEWQAISDFITELFWANVNDLVLSVHHGSTGLAVIRKLSPMGAPYAPPVAIRKRGFAQFAMMKAKKRLKMLAR